jgi:hypothetical protein
VISVAYSGQTLGQFSAEQIAAMLESGRIDKTAYYWVDGMAEWRPITEIIQEVPQAPAPPAIPLLKKRDADAPNQNHVNFLARRGFPTAGMTKQEVQSVFERIKAEETRRANEMTEKQRAFCDYHGITYTSQTTKFEASALIGNADFPDSHWNTYKHLIRPDLYEKPQGSLSTKDELKDAKTRLASAEDDYRKLQAKGDADPDDLESAKEEIGYIREEVEDLKAQIEDDKLAKQEGVDDVSSFVDSWAEGYYEHSGEDVERFKKVVKKPTKTQYKALTEKLSADLGLSISALSLDQFLCLYVQRFPEVLKEPYKSKGFPQLSVQIPKTYQQQLQIQNAANNGGTTLCNPKKGCLGLFLMCAAFVGALLALVAVLAAHDLALLVEG